MQTIRVIAILENALNFVDSRLISHGRRVAYRVYKALGNLGHYDEERMRPLLQAALLHDIGAYKTEEIDRHVAFETKEMWDHSIYGYLFFKHFSPIPEMAPVLFFHHCDCRDLGGLDPSYHEMAQVFFLADRLDLVERAGVIEADRIGEYFRSYRDTRVAGRVMDAMLEDGAAPLPDSSLLLEDDGFRRLLYDTAPDGAETDAWIDTINAIIDFRSPQTVTHTVAVACIARMLARLVGMESQEGSIVRGAMLHDIGKTGIPSAILESSGRLTDKEMAVMRNHVILSDEILRGCVDDTVRKIAVRHHEKLDGSGYPDGLTAEELTPAERLLAVADIFSALYGVRSYKGAYPRGKIAGILHDMARRGQLDGGLVSEAVEHFDAITAEVDRASAPVVEAYHAIKREFNELMDRALHPEAGRLVIPDRYPS